MDSIGVTGGIAVGKSRVARYLAAAGDFALLDVDELARQLLAPDQAGWRALVELTGKRFLRPDRQVDRPALRRAIFADAALRGVVEQLLHPLIRELMHRRLAELAGQGWRRTLVEVPLLYEAGWEADFAGVLVVWAPPEICLARLLARDGVDRQQAEAALAAQLDPDVKAARAHWLLDNSGPWEETRRRLNRLQKRLQNFEKS